jgi:simple sugar transport system permease protein
VAFGLKAGLFNIGAQGQLLFGALAAAWAGVAFTGFPALVHAPIALLTGALAGGSYAAAKGALKAYTGAHEVITGIMLNYVAIDFTEYIASGPFRDTASGSILARTPRILESAVIPHVGAIPLGFVLAMVMAAGLWLVLDHSVVGFEIRTVGLNIDASRYAGIRVNRTVILTMALSGMMAGLGGAVETQEIVYRYQPGFNVGLGFDGITVALLARTHPLGVIPAAVLLGAMRAGAGYMQFDAGVAPEIVDVIQALILFFIAADMLIRRMVRLSGKDREPLPLTAGWGRIT